MIDENLDSSADSIKPGMLVRPGIAFTIKTEASRNDVMTPEEERLAQLVEKDRRIKQLELSLKDSDSEVEHLNQRIEELELMIHEVWNSASYKIAHRVARAMRRIAPLGSGRRHALHLGFRAVKALPKLRVRQWVRQRLTKLWNRSSRGLGLVLLACRIEKNRFVGLERARVRAIPNLPRFSPHDQVDASIIIPVFNHWRDSLACLESIARFTSGRLTKSSSSMMARPT